MDRFGIISYNRYGNFTNYGSALQTWALSQVINRIGQGRYESVIVNYCPKSHLKWNILNPLPLMWDQDAQSQMECRLSLPAIQKNYEKFESFFLHKLMWTHDKYDYTNFDKAIGNEGLSGFICGSDTIFCIDETKGFDDGFYGNFRSMRGGFTIAYAASFGDSHFDEHSLAVLRERIGNFKAIGLREQNLLPFVTSHTDVPVRRTLDPTLLLDVSDYERITDSQAIKERYVLLYARRYNKAMFDYAEKVSTELGCRLVDISLRASYTERGHLMRYDAGVEEFLSLVKNAEYVVTNSFHGLIFAFQYRRPFVVFTREQADTKIDEVLQVIGLSNRKVRTTENLIMDEIDFDKAHELIIPEREGSTRFIEQSLNMYYER